MVVMAVVVVVVVIAVVGAVIARYAWRQSVDERESVRHYQHALETLSHLSEHEEGRGRPTSARAEPAEGAAQGLPGQQGLPGEQSLPGSPPPQGVPPNPLRDRGRVPMVRTIETGHTPTVARDRVSPARMREDQVTQQASAMAPGPWSPREPVGGGSATRDNAPSGTPADEPPALVFVDDSVAGSAGWKDPDDWSRPEEQDRSSELGGAHPRTRPTGLRPGQRSVRGELSRSRRPGLSNIPLRAAVGVAALLLAVAVVSVALLGTGGPGHRAVSKGRPGGKTPVATSPAHGGGKTPTTVPPTVVPVSSTASGGTYTAPTGSYTVQLSAAGPCWVMARETATGNVVWTGTLVAGQQQPLPASGTMTVELGAAGEVSITLDGKSVSLPSGYQSPFLMTFQPS